MDNNVVGNVNFKFAARFSKLIGRNLISNPIVANLNNNWIRCSKFIISVDQIIIFNITNT